MCFVDFKKASDSISHDVLWVTMMDIGYPLHLIDLLAKLYRKQLAKVKVARTLSEWFSAEKRVRQGCVLSPYLFNILAEMVTRETFDGFQGGQHQDVDRRTLRGRVIQNDSSEINGESMSMVWPTLGSRTPKEQNRTAEPLQHVTNPHLSPQRVSKTVVFKRNFRY